MEKKRSQSEEELIQELTKIKTQPDQMVWPPKDTSQLDPIMQESLKYNMDMSENPSPIILNKFPKTQDALSRTPASLPQKPLKSEADILKEEQAREYQKLNQMPSNEQVETLKNILQQNYYRNR